MAGANPQALAAAGALGGRLVGSPERSLHGVVLSNELLDALPVHRYAWDARAGGWREQGVDTGPAGFHWVIGPTLGIAGLPAWMATLPAPLLEVLPDGFTLEDCPAATAWWSQAARRLARGRLLTLDYGLVTTERLDPGRAGGTLRSIRAHRITEDPLADPGEQDLTAQVDFTLLEQAGVAAGLRTETLTTQGRFIGEAATRLLQPGRLGLEWTAARKRQLQTLMHPSISAPASASLPADARLNGPAQARTSRITSPSTLVRRRWTPLCSKVSFSWSSPSRCMMVALRS